MEAALFSLLETPTYLCAKLYQSNRCTEIRSYGRDSNGRRFWLHRGAQLYLDPEPPVEAA
jgi:hypothetical protein